MSKIYHDGTYLESNPTWHVEDSPWKAKQIVKLIERNKVSPSSVCEIGCGAGEVLVQLSKQLPGNVKFSGYDISEQAYMLCQEKSKENISFYHQDLFQEETAFFDVVLAIDVFEHVEDYFGFLRQLKTKATFKIFHIPLDISVYSVLRNYPMGIRKDAGHLQYFTKDTALATLEDTGHKIVDYFYTPWSIEQKQQGLMKAALKPPRWLFFKFAQDFTVRLLGGYSLIVLAT